MAADQRQREKASEAAELKKATREARKRNGQRGGKRGKNKRRMKAAGNEPRQDAAAREAKRKQIEASALAFRAKQNSRSKHMTSMEEGRTIALGLMKQAAGLMRSKGEAPEQIAAKEALIEALETTGVEGLGAKLSELKKKAMIPDFNDINSPSTVANVKQLLLQGGVDGATHPLLDESGKLANTPEANADWIHKKMQQDRSETLLPMAPVDVANLRDLEMASGCPLMPPPGPQVVMKRDVKLQEQITKLTKRGEKHICNREWPEARDAFIEAFTLAPEDTGLGQMSKSLTEKARVEAVWKERLSRKKLPPIHITDLPPDVVISLLRHCQGASLARLECTCTFFAHPPPESTPPSTLLHEDLAMVKLHSLTSQAGQALNGKYGTVANVAARQEGLSPSSPQLRYEVEVFLRPKMPLAEFNLWDATGGGRSGKMNFADLTGSDKKQIEELTKAKLVTKKIARKNLLVLRHNMCESAAQENLRTGAGWAMTADGERCIEQDNDEALTKSWQLRRRADENWKQALVRLEAQKVRVARRHAPVLRFE